MVENTLRDVTLILGRDIESVRSKTTLSFPRHGKTLEIAAHEGRGGVEIEIWKIELQDGAWAYH